MIRSRSQLRGVYGEHIADEIIANCGVEAAFTPKELRVANDLSDRLGYIGQDSITKSRQFQGLFGNRSQTITDQRRALMLPQELMQFSPDKLILLRGGIPPIIGTKIAYFSSRFFKSRALLPPEVPAIPKPTPIAEPPPQFREMTTEEAAGHETRPMSQDDVLTKDCPSFFADMLTLDRDGNVSGLIEEGDENGG